MVTERVLVGVDGSEHALDAVDWAAAEAVARGATLTVCCAASIGEPDRPMLWNGQEAVVVPADEVIDAAAMRAQAVPGIGTVARLVGFGDPAELLSRWSAGAQLLVVGARGLGAFVGMVAGSVSEKLAGHAHCPVVVVRHPARAGATPVVVGVDASAANQSAVAFAFAEAALRGAELVVVTAAGGVEPLPLVGPPAGPIEDLNVIEEAARARQDDAVRPWREKFPQVPVRSVVVVDGAARALINGSEEAALVVVGSRGHGTLAGLLLGAVSSHVLRHAACPVAIVRPGD